MRSKHGREKQTGAVKLLGKERKLRNSMLISFIHQFVSSLEGYKLKITKTPPCPKLQIE
jgi:hypothetical protein